VLKHNASVTITSYNLHLLKEFTNDLPALLEKATEFRLSVLNNPEKPYSKDLLFAQGIEDNSEDDYLVNFSLQLMAACSQCEKVPSMISRILMNNLAIQINEGEIEWTPKH
jgi:hypothetical protein